MIFSDINKFLMNFLIIFIDGLLFVEEKKFFIFLGVGFFGKFVFVCIKICIEGVGIIIILRIKG